MSGATAGMDHDAVPQHQQMPLAACAAALGIQGATWPAARAESDQVHAVSLLQNQCR